MFKDCKCLEDVKKRFRELAKKLHPDNGGSAEAFKAMKQEYEAAYNRYRNTHRSSEGEYYEKETKQTAQEWADIIERIINIKEIQIEICGTWVWVTGDTKAHKEEIKAAGYRWAQNKQAWYWHDGSYKKWHGKKKFSMDDIRAKYGSQKVKEKEEV